jgi:hypothetical protein
MPLKNKKCFCRNKLFDDLEWSDTEYRHCNIAKGLMSDTDTLSIIADPDDDLGDPIMPDEDGSNNGNVPGGNKEGNGVPAPPDPLPTAIVMQKSTTNYRPFVLTGHNKPDTTLWTATSHSPLGANKRTLGAIVPYYIPFFKGPNPHELHPIDLQITSNETTGTVSYNNQSFPLQMGKGVTYTCSEHVTQPLQVRHFNFTIGSSTQSVNIVRYYKHIPDDITITFFVNGSMGQVVSSYSKSRDWRPTPSTIFTFPPLPYHFVSFNINAKLMKLYVLRNGIRTLIKPQPMYTVPAPAWTTIGFDLTNYPNDTTFVVDLISTNLSTISAIGLAYKNA